MKVEGKFELKLSPMDCYAQGAGGITLGRMSIDKTFYGDLSATSKGEMLNAITPEKGSAGYVAIEQVIGTLSGRNGSFVLQHYGMMKQDASLLILEVVPGSGAAELAGLEGKMTIKIEAEQHYYEFDYVLA